MDGGGDAATVRRMKAFSVTALAAVVATTAAPALSGPVKRHERREEHRIEQGVRRGDITPREEQRLENQQETIEDERQDAREDGKVSKRERRDIRHDQHRLSRDIERKKQNDRERR
jgi:hypothetical protein